ncbi:MAG: TlpA family protein disulfide reductase [Ignavibacterium sp.]|nr:TlpA family protein disulfide reductase [Ignavibacterium sp.]
MKYFALVLIFLISNSNAFTQQINIKVENLNQEKATLYSLSGETSEFVDTLSAINEGTFQFSLAKKRSGFYRFSCSNNKKIDLIYDNEDVEIITDANNILDSLKVSKSEENKIYYEFVKLNKDYKTKTELLQLIIARYPETDNYYQITKEKLNQIQEEYLYFVNVTAQINPNSFIARYVRTAQLPVVESEVPFDEQLLNLKTHSLDNVNFNDDGLIYSDAFTNKTIEYLSFYRNPQLPMALLEKEFQTAVDSILNKAKVNDIVYKHIVEYMLDGFKKFGFDNVINYIIDNYVIADDICLDEKLETALERRIQQNKLFKPGFIVPDIEFADSSGLMIKLSEITIEKTLLIFYASWCPHCTDMLPQIYNLYKNQKEKKFEVIAISIDTSKTDWLNFIRTNKLDWLNISDLKGWEGKAVLDYNIYATPTLFLLDREKKLIKPIIDLNELKAL